MHLRAKIDFLALPLLFAGVLLSENQARRPVVDVFPRFDQLLVDRHGIQDAALIVGGHRGVAADIAWIQLLQYIGGKVLPEENPSRNLDFLKSFALRVTRIDPYFRRAYLMSASMLAWFPSIDRPGEAMEVLEEGIRYNPDYWPLQTYMAAIGYKRSDQFDKMSALLETTIRHPECPNLVKAILANAYKEHGRYRDAVRIWVGVLEDPKEESVHQRARQAIQDIESLLARGEKDKKALRRREQR